MANLVKQFRFYSNPNGDTPSKNQPNTAVGNDYVTGSIFANYFPIFQLGIQALPGTMFYLNNAADPIIIGKTGIYELDLQEETEISDIRFNAESIETINNNKNAYLIVDIIYQSREES